MSQAVRLLVQFANLSLRPRNPCPGSGVALCPGFHQRGAVHAIQAVLLRSIEYIQKR